MHTYHPPVDKLLSLGEVKIRDKWMNYADLGLTRQEIPALIRLATDADLHWEDKDGLDVWAPLHAWRALAQLGAVEAIEPLVNQIDELDEDDWYGEELPTVLQMLGPRALGPLESYLMQSAQQSNPGLGYFTATEAVEKIGAKYLEARAKAITLLTNLLANYATQNESFNAKLIDSLLELRGRKALALIAAAIHNESVDTSIVNWQNVQEDFRLPSTSKPADYVE